MVLCTLSPWTQLLKLSAAVCSSQFASRHLSTSDSRADRAQMWLASKLRQSCTTATMALVPGKRRGPPTKRRRSVSIALQGLNLKSLS